MTVFSVFLGGGIGSVLRWLVTSRIASHWGVMLANVFGAMLIGMASEYFLSRADLRPEVRSFIVTGFLGGFTTFSTYLLDFNHLLSHENGRKPAFIWRDRLWSVLLFCLPDPD